MQSSSLVKTSSFSVFVALQLLFLFSPPSVDARVTTAGGAESLVNQVCTQNQYPNICIAALRADPRSASADMTQLGSISVNLALKNAIEAENFIHIQQRQGSAGLKAPLADCAGKYADAIKNLQVAVSQFARRDYRGASASVFNAINDVEDCGDAFDPFGPLMTTRNHKVTALIDAVRDITGSL